MSKLRVVGGPSDGIWVECGSRDVTLIDPREPCTSLDFTSADDVVTISYTHYTKRRLRGPNDWELWYLAPSDWSDAMAIEHQFRK